MKFSLRFWTMAVLVSSVFVACNRAPEAPSGSSADQPAAAPAPAQPSSPQEPSKAEAPRQNPADAPPAKSGGSSSPAAAAAPTPSDRAAPANSARTAAGDSVKAGAPAPAPPPVVVNVPSGTKLTVVMTDSVGTDTSKVGDTFAASLGEPVIVDGKTVIAKGTRVRGRVETVDEPGRVKGKAALSLVLTDVLRPDKAYRIATEPFRAEAGSETKENAVKVGGGAAIGAIVGAIAGGKKGAAIGAGVGGGAGTAAVLGTKGKQIKIESETRVNFVLKQDVDIELTKSTS